MPTSSTWATVGFTDGKGSSPEQCKVAAPREGRMLLDQQNKSPLQIANLSAGQATRAMSQ